MRIRYRDPKGRFTTKQKASRYKKVTSELISDTNRTVGKQRGYYDSPKKLARAVLPSIRKPVSRTSSRAYKAPPEIFEDAPEDLETQWDEEYSDEFPELDLYFDGLDDLLTDEDEWYENPG